MAYEIDPPTLRALCSVAEHGSLTRAAASLGVDQSMLSRRITALERQLGLRLFHRNGRGVAPTELALRLMPRARTILAETQALVDEARGEGSSPAGIVELGLVPAVSRPLLGALVVRVRTDFPRIRLRALEGYSGQVEEWLAGGRVDIGVFNRYGRGEVPGAELLLESDVVLAARRGSLAAIGPSIAFRSLDRLPLVLPARPNSLVSAISDIAMRQKVEIDIALEAGSSGMIRDAVAGAGLATLLPEHLARREYPHDEFSTVRVTRPSLHQRAWLALTTQRGASLAVRTVARLLRELARHSR